MFLFSRKKNSVALNVVCKNERKVSISTFKKDNLETIYSVTARYFIFQFCFQHLSLHCSLCCSQSLGKIPCREIRAKTNIKDVVKFAAKQKWKWAGHVARLNDNRWTKRITDWQPRYGKRSRGRQVKRWRDDIVQMKGITWGRDAGQRDDWRRDAEGYILQWVDGASV